MSCVLQHADLGPEQIPGRFRGGAKRLRSITTYDSEGWLAKDKAAISSSEATPNPNGSYTVWFNSPGSQNNVETPSPFTALLRIYVPKSKDGVNWYLKNASKDLVIK
jgi:hypothetical protein